VDLPKDPSIGNGPPPKHASFSQLPTSPHGASPRTGDDRKSTSDGPAKPLEHSQSGVCPPASYTQARPLRAPWHLAEALHAKLLPLLVP
jgi:hypothetical protein